MRAIRVAVSAMRLKYFWARGVGITWAGDFGLEGDRVPAQKASKFKGGKVSVRIGIYALADYF